MPGVGNQRFVSMTGVSADEVRGAIFDATAYPYVTAFVKGTGTIEAGAIQFEEADYDPSEFPSAGWSNLGSSYAVTGTDVTAGGQEAIHFPVAKFRFIRPLIADEITGGGTISVVFVAMGPS